MVSDAVDLIRIVALLPTAEIWRRFTGPRDCAAHFRERGARCTWRSPERRLRLRRLIRAVDVCLPDGGNCYRRALIEMALDRTSAAEPLHFGLVKGGGLKSGHAWLSSDPAMPKAYDAEFTI